MHFGVFFMRVSELEAKICEIENHEYLIRSFLIRIPHTLFHESVNKTFLRVENDTFVNASSIYHDCRSV